MPTVKNINDLRNLSLGLIDDIINEKYKFNHQNEGQDKMLLESVNKQVINAIQISKLELDYHIKNNTGKQVKFFEYEN